MAFCSECGFKNSSDASFCEDCGHPLATEALRAATSASSSLEAITARSHARTRKAILIGLAALSGLGAGAYVLIEKNEKSEAAGYSQSRSDGILAKIRGVLFGSALSTGADAASTIREFAAKKGDLTRESAGVLLNKHIGMDSTKILEFQSAEKLNAAVNDGLIARSNDCLWRPNLRFTRKLELILGDMAAGPCIAETDMSSRRRILLKKPLQVRFNQVTGITDGPQPGSKVVEYETEYVFPPKMDELKKYVYSGVRHHSTFRKYDDGWRVSE